MTKLEIKDYIKKNNQKSNKEIANELNITPSIVSANRYWLNNNKKKLLKIDSIELSELTNKKLMDLRRSISSKDHSKLYSLITNYINRPVKSKIKFITRLNSLIDSINNDAYGNVTNTIDDISSKKSFSKYNKKQQSKLITVEQLREIRSEISSTIHKTLYNKITSRISGISLINKKFHDKLIKDLTEIKHSYITGNRTVNNVIRIETNLIDFSKIRLYLKKSKYISTDKVYIYFCYAKNNKTINKFRLVDNLRKLNLTLSDVIKTKSAPSVTLVNNKKPSMYTKGIFKNVDAENKAKARTKIIMAIANTRINSGNMLVLPSNGCKMELQLNRLLPTNRFTYDAVESNKEVYFQLMKTAFDKKLNMNLYNGKMSDVIYKAEPNSKSHLVLDYCGTLATFHEEIKYAIDNNLVVKGGTVSITLSRIGLQNNKGIVDKLLSNIPNNLFDGIKETDLAVTLFMYSLLGDNYELIEKFNYTDTSPMSLFVLKRIK